MTTNSDTGKFNIMGYINGYIMSVCGKPHRKTKPFTVQISTSSKASVDMFGTCANSNVGPIDISANGTVT